MIFQKIDYIMQKSSYKDCEDYIYLEEDEVEYQKLCHKLCTAVCIMNHHKENQDNLYFAIALPYGMNTLRFLVADKNIDPKKADDWVNKMLNIIKKQYVNLNIEFQNKEEITCADFVSNLKIAAKDHIISNYDDVEKQLNITLFDSIYSLNFGEYVVSNLTKEQIYKNAENTLAKEDLTVELDRIYGSFHESSTSGIPVHYIIKTDQYNNRKFLYRPLITALYNNKRIKSARYTYIDMSDSSGNDFDELESIYKSASGGTVVIRISNDLNGSQSQIDNLTSLFTECCTQAYLHKHLVQTIFVIPKASSNIREIIAQELGEVHFVTIEEESLIDEAALKVLKKLAKDNHFRIDSKLKALVEPGKSYSYEILESLYYEWHNNKLLESEYSCYKDSEVLKVDELKKKAKGSAYEELNEMIGLNNAKAVLNKALAYYKMNKIYKNRGITNDIPSMHMCFLGSPGTAKTSAARLFGRILKDNKILPVGNFVEVGKADLCERFVGWTAKTVKEKFKQARGGILFIDECYSLADEDAGGFGQEAIDTIVAEMENNRKDTIVIFGGYKNLMEKFFSKNPGLRSRVAFNVEFEDYSTSELLEIAKLMANKMNIKFGDGVIEKLTQIFASARTEPDFGNGRFVRNILENSKMNLAQRVVLMDYENVSDDVLTTIIPEDIEYENVLRKKPEKIEVIRQIGFAC